MTDNQNTAAASVLALSAMFLFMIGSACTAHRAGQPEDIFTDLSNRGYRNVIVMIPDGCDGAIQTVARWYTGGGLQLDRMGTTAATVHMANSVITGSAAAATAFATGHKTSSRFVGVGPRTEDLLTGVEPTAAPYAPVASILEAARLAGKATGIVATSRVTHATPAAFASHIHDRGLDNEIMEHMVYNGIDVVFGGGARHLIPSGDVYATSFGDRWKGKRSDGENLMEVLRSRGYQFVDSKDGMAGVSSGKVWGLFDDSHLDPDIDRGRSHPSQPSLAEMTGKAIDLLSRDDDGFFLVVESSQVDWAAHNNDPIYMVTEFIAFDEAVRVACDFADRDGRTLVLAFPDHNTGGLAIGHYRTPMSYTATTIEDLIGPLKGMTMTSSGLVGVMNDPKDDAELIATVKTQWGMEITQNDVDEIRNYALSESLSYAIAAVISNNYTVFGWTTHGHTGETVPVWIYGADAPRGIIDNTALAKIAAAALGVDLDTASRRLYVDLDSVTSGYDIDMDTDPANPVLTIGGALLPISKDLLMDQERTVQLPGLTVYAPATGKVYISKDAVRLLRLP